MKEPVIYSDTVDTLILTESGLRPIEEIHAGDYVWSENTKTGEKELKRGLSLGQTRSSSLQSSNDNCRRV